VAPADQLRPLVRQFGKRGGVELAVAVVGDDDHGIGGSDSVLRRCRRLVTADPTDESGRRSLQGQHPAQIADEVRPIVADIINELNRWLTTLP
jgi:hypothetical protein